MKTLFDRLIEKATDKASKYRNWVTENWLSYTLLKYLFFLFFFALFYLILLISVIVDNLVVAWFSLPIFVAVFAFFLLESNRILVVEKSPAEFVKAEKVERFFEILFGFWVLYY